jgi:hypothetical protein
MKKCQQKVCNNYTIYTKIRSTPFSSVSHPFFIHVLLDLMPLLYVLFPNYKFVYFYIELMRYYKISFNGK